MAAGGGSRAARGLTLLARLLVGGIFVYAAWSKLRNPASLFAISIDSYRLLPDWAILPVARTLPWVELALGLLLLSGLLLRYVAALSSGLLLLFFSVMLHSYSKGLGIDCGCFGVGEALGVKTLVRDGLVVLVALLLTAAAFVTARGRREVAGRNAAESLE